MSDSGAGGDRREQTAAASVSAARVCAPFGAVVTIAYLCARVKVLGLHFAFIWPSPYRSVAPGRLARSSSSFRPVDFLLTCRSCC